MGGGVVTMSPTPAERAALKVAQAAASSRDGSYDLVSTVVFALGSAQLLQSPETAQEMAHLRVLADQMISEPHGCGLCGIPKAVHAALSHSWRRPGDEEIQARMAARRTVRETAAAMARLRARVTELEQERHLTNEALAEMTEACRTAEARVAELEQQAAAALIGHVQYDDSEHCQSDGEPWPCPTVRVLGPADASEAPVPFLLTEQAGAVVSTEVAESAARLRSLLGPGVTS